MSFSIRHATDEDLPALQHLQQFTNPSFQVSDGELLHRVKLSHEAGGALVLLVPRAELDDSSEKEHKSRSSSLEGEEIQTAQVDDDSSIESTISAGGSSEFRIAGVLYYVRRPDRDCEILRYDQVFDQSNPLADTIYWIHLVIDPQSRSLLDQFHKAACRYCFEELCADRICALTHCSDPVEGQITSLETLKEYISSMTRTDRNLFLHTSHGAKYTKLIPGYNPRDSRNAGYAVCMEYLREPVQQPVRQVRTTTEKLSAQQLHDLVCTALGRSENTNLDENQPWFDLGFDSVSLMDLHGMIEANVGQSMDVSFLFATNTLSKLIQELAVDEKLVQDYASEVSEKTEASAPTSDLGVLGIGLRFPNVDDSASDLESLEAFSHALYNDDCKPDSYRRLVQRERFSLELFSRGVTLEQARCIPLSQRVALEVSMSAIADGPPGLLDSINRCVGVFVGAWDGGCSQHPSAACLRASSAHSAAAFSNSILANRVSYYLDLTGPSVVVDTACSSSLVALDYAMKSIEAGECKAALVLGVNIIDDERTVLLRQGGFLSSTDACHAFDDRADGYARSEGAGALLIAPMQLSEITTSFTRAKICSVAVNQDGKTANLHAPNPNAQSNLIRKACAKAAIDPMCVAFVQTHGTGTRLGDPIEAAGLYSALTAASQRSRPLYLASIKSQFGHLEGAAGMIGLISTIVSLQTQELHPNRRLCQRNPAIRFNEYQMEPVPQESPVDLTPFTREGGKLIAGVSSFGFGGTNAHALLQAFGSRISQKSICSRKLINWNEDARVIPFSPALEEPLDQFYSDKIMLKLEDHKVGTLKLIPGSFWVSLLSQQYPGCYIEQLEFLAATTLPVPSNWSLTLRQATHKAYLVDMTGKNLCAATFAPMRSRPEETKSLKEAREQCAEPIDLRSFYAELGNQYGPHFQAMRDAWKDSNGTIVLARLEVNVNEVENNHGARCLSQAVIIDAAAHACFLTLNKGQGEVASLPHYAKGFGSFWCSADWIERDLASISWWCLVTKSKSSLQFDWKLFSTDGQIVMDACDFTMACSRNTRSQPQSELTFEGVTCANIVWERLSENQLGALRKVPADNVIDTPTCEKLHDCIVGILKQDERPPRICIRINEPGQEGYARSLRLEMPDWQIHTWCGPRSQDVQILESEHELLCTEDGHIAVRRLRRIKNSLNSEEAQLLVAVKKNATYIITGGAGALGRKFAAELIKRGAGKVLLLGRASTFSASKSELTEKIEYQQCDITDRNALKKIVKPVTNNLAGAFHCAGVLRDATIPNLEDFDEVFAGKVSGAECLIQVFHELHVELDFLILCSSVTACFGSAGQANYAAANSVLDALAEQNAFRNTTSIQWGPWQGESSMAAASLARWQRLGLNPMDPKMACNSLFSLRKNCGPVICITHLDHTAPGAQSSWAKSPLACDLVTESKNLSQVNCSTDINFNGSFSQQIVKTVASSFLNTENLVLETPWREAGLDSLAMVEFKNMLRTAIPDHIPMRDTVLFDYPTPQALIEYLSEFDEARNPHTESSGKQTTIEPNFDQLGSTTLEVTGAACRLPGGVDSPESFWRLLEAGTDTMTDIPIGRFDWESSADRIYARKAAFVDHVERFDYSRFNITEVEASNMDPQQRLVLQVAADAIEQADLQPNTRVGVFVGVMTNDWARMMDPATPTAYSAAGQIPCILANRVSYILGLQGPSMAIDTACSSGLVALDTAAASIQRGDCNAALVIGVNLILDQGVHSEECAARMLSTVGRCATFSEDADGYARGEGCVALVLEPGSALSSNRKSWGTILGTAVNQDGRSANLTSPNGRAQVDVIRRAQARAKVSPSDISYLETHGTGTPLGDPIEVGAIVDAFKGHSHKLCLGALKTLIGHGEAVAGLSGVLKALLCLNHRRVPSDLHHHKTNPKILDIITPWIHFPQHEPFPLPEEPIAGVSAFGFGGTNAHVIVKASLAPSPLDFQSGLLYNNTISRCPRLPWTRDELVYSVGWVTLPNEQTKNWASQSNSFHIKSYHELQEVISTFSENETVELNLLTTSASVAALIRCLRLSRPRWSVKLVYISAPESKNHDLDLQNMQVDSSALEQKIDQDGMIKVPRLHKQPGFLPYSLRLERCGPILLSGASGGLGTAILESLLSAGATKIYAISRQGKPSTEKLQPLLAVALLSGVLEYLQCDVSVEIDVKQLAEKLNFENITTVLHAAGILNEKSIDQLDDEVLSTHMNVKVLGTQNLLRYFPKASFMGFSSTSSIFGMKDAPAYAMCNAAMEFEVDKARNQGRHAVAILWDLWKETGMASDRAMGSEHRGLSTRRGCQILLGILQMWHEQDSHMLVILAANLQRLRKTISEPALLDDLTTAEYVSTSQSANVTHFKAASSLQLTLADQTLETWPSLIEEWILKKSKQLQASHTSEIDSLTPWQQAGFDSLSMTEFTASLNTSLGLKGTMDELSDTVMFDHPNPNDLAKYIAELYKTTAAAASTRTTEPPMRDTRTKGSAEAEAEAAIVSIALRFPGSRENSTPAGFWDFLCSGKDAIVNIPRARIPDLATAPGENLHQVYVRKGAFLHPDLFHADISKSGLSLSDAECEIIDPHQRLSLQVAAEALASAEKTGADMTCVGVFVGAQNTEYILSQAHKVSTYTATGTALSIIANRISFVFNLTGPSMTVDTACSSSLVALDAALKALHAGDCTSALVLAVDLMLSPHRFETTCAAQMLSPQGRCATFSDQADGYARGEGCAALVITLDSTCNLPAWGVVRGIALNQDGRSANLTSPRGPAQVACIERALQRASLNSIEEVSFIEAHGTGTKLGDPQEMEALSAVFKTRTKPLPVGAVKSSIGHLEAAAGLAGIIKSLLCLKNGSVPANLHCNNLNPRLLRIQGRCPLVFPKCSVELNAKAEGRLAGVSSFGFGGTNGHVVLSGVSEERSSRAEMCFVSKLLPAKVFKLQQQLTGSSSHASQQRWKFKMLSEMTNLIRNHRVGNLSVLPATSYMEIVQPLFEGKALSFSNLDLRSMYFIPDNEEELEFDVTYDLSSEIVSIISSRDHCLRAQMNVKTNQSLVSRRVDLPVIQQRCTIELPGGDDLYQGVGNQYAGPFRSLKFAWANQDGSELLGKLSVDQNVALDVLSSAWLDAASHVALAALQPSERKQPVYAAKVIGYELADVQTKQNAAKDSFLWTYIKQVSLNTFDMQIFRKTGEVLAEVHNFSFGFFSRGASLNSGMANEQNLLWKDNWESILTTSNSSDFVSNEKIEILDVNTTPKLLTQLTHILSQHSAASLLIPIRDPGQRGLVACVRREYPHATLSTIGGEQIDLPTLQNILLIAQGLPGNVDLRLKSEDRDSSNPNLEILRGLEPIITCADELPLVQIIKGATYIITGGAGALGQHFGSYIAAYGGIVILLGRTKPEHEIPEGCTFLSCDITCNDAVKEVVRRCKDLRGIIHCAGLLKDATLQTASVADFDIISAPKILGIKTLLQQADCKSLDFCVLFSSIAASVGSAGQSIYGSVNAELDMLAHELHCSGMNVVSIRWGPWAGAGMASSLTEKWRRMQLVPLKPEDAVRELFNIPRGMPVVTICGFIQENKEIKLEKQARESIDYQSPRTKEELINLVLNIAQEVSPDHSSFELDDSWREAGLDSLAMVEFRNVLQSRLGGSSIIEIEDTILFDYPNASLLVEWLTEKLPVQIQGETTGAASPQQNDDDSHIQSWLVTGAACRLPAGVDSLEKYWQLLCSGEHAMQKIPKSRFDIEAAFDADPSTPFKSYVDQAALVDDIYSFDNSKFGISDQEAIRMDPQQRLAVECAYEAMVSAGLAEEPTKAGTKLSLRNIKMSEVGVYVGMMTNDWAKMNHGAPSPFTATGHSPAIAANRISYLLGLTGPSMTVDTACSSSIVALDAACRALSSGDCDAAIVIGVNLILTSDLFIEECAARMLSPRGFCSTFSAEADGYARGEGCVALVLQRKKHNHVEDSQRVLGEILGVAVNQDGRSANITSPNGRAQEEVIRMALKRAHATPQQIAYVETHGTGTALGDPLEISALARVFADRETPLIIGAAKASIGHTEGASGLAGLLKALLCVYFKEVPGLASLAKKTDLSPKVRNAALEHMVFPVRGNLQSLPSNSLVGLSSFGFGGTNTHTILRASSGKAKFDLSLASRSIVWTRKTFLPRVTSVKSHGGCNKVQETSTRVENQLNPSNQKDVPQRHALLSAGSLPENECPTMFAVKSKLPTYALLDLLMWCQHDTHKNTSGYLTWASLKLQSSTVKPSHKVKVGMSKITSGSTILCEFENVTQLQQSLFDDGTLPIIVSQNFNWVSRSPAWLKHCLAQVGWRKPDWLVTDVKSSLDERMLRLTFSKPLPRPSGYFWVPELLGECVMALGLVQARRHEVDSQSRVDVPPSLSFVETMVCSLSNILFHVQDSSFVGPLECTIEATRGLLHITSCETGHVLFYLKGARCEFGKEIGETTSYVRRWIPHVRPSFPRQVTGDSRFTMNDVKKYVHPREVKDRVGDEALEVYCAHYIRRALSMLPAGFIPAEPHLQFLLNRWKDQYSNAQSFESLKDIEPTGVEYEFAQNCVEALPEIMQGRRPALDVLFSKPDLTTRLYSESTPSLTCNNAIAQAVKGIAQSKYSSEGDSKVLRILELGAGTGGTTMHLVKFLKLHQTEYFFTDISDYFLRQAEETFSAYSDMMRYTLLNVENSLHEQGFAMHQFDVIIASNIIHATQELHVTLGHIADLLVPGGCFLLNEATISTAFLDATFALTSGWWRFAEANDPARPERHGPLLSPQKWFSVLKENGFTQTEVIHEAAQGQAVICGIRNSVFSTPTISTSYSNELCVIGNGSLANALKASSDGHEGVEPVYVLVPPADNSFELQKFFDVLKSLASGKLRTSKLIIVTRRDKNPWHGALWGITRSMMLESIDIQQLICMDIDDHTSFPSVVQAVHYEINAPQCPSNILQLRFIRGERHEAELHELKAIASPSASKLRGTYVITGGLGGLGLLTAAILLRQGLRNLVLVSRSGKLRRDDASACIEKQLLEEIKSYNDATVRFIACNVRSRESLEENVFDIIDRDTKLPPVKGIVHAAGILSNHSLSAMDWSENFSPVYETKATSAWNLDIIARERQYELDHFVLYSSAASTFGSAGQSNHAAANEVMDAIIEKRCLNGLCGVSVQWGGWDDLGAAVASSKAQSTILARGMGLISIENGTRSIIDVFSSAFQEPVFGVSIVFWDSFGPQQVDRLFLKRYVKLPTSEKGRKEALATEDTTTFEHSSSLSATTELVASLLQDCGIADMDVPLSDQGLDSLTSIELIGLVQQHKGVKLSPTFYLDCVNGHGLARMLENLCNSCSTTSNKASQNIGDSVPATATSNKQSTLENSLWIEPLFAPTMRLYCFAYAGGHPNVFREWTFHIPANVQICPIAMPGYGKQTNRAFWKSVRELSANITSSIPTDVPFALAGSCLGAIISFEVARSLRNAGKRLPLHHFAIACSAPQDYSRALRLLYSNRLKENAFFVPSEESDAAVRFQDLSIQERDDTVRDLHQLGFFKDEETLANLTQNQVYFEYVMAQIAGQMQLAERYVYDQTVQPSNIPVTAISGKLDDTIPEDWPKSWETHTRKASSFRHVEIKDGGHYIIQTHVQEVTAIILEDLSKYHL